MSQLLGYRVPGEVDTKGQIADGILAEFSTRLTGVVDDKAGGGGWPFANIWTVSSTDPDANFTTLALALADANVLAGHAILLDAETMVVTAAIAVSKAVFIIAHPGGTTITTSTINLSVLNITAAARVMGVTITNTAATGANTGVLVNAANVVLKDGAITVNGAAATTNIGVNHISGTGLRLESCFISSIFAVTSHGYINQTGTVTAEIYGGKIAGDTFDIRGSVAASTIALYGVVLTHNTINYDGSVERSGNTSFDRARTNPIINGAFQVWQRGITFAAVVTGAYTADRWMHQVTGTAVHTISQSADVPTVAQAGVLAPFSVLIDCTTVDAAIAAGDFVLYTHRIEGFNWVSLAQRQITLSFWVKATKVGTYCVSVRNSGTDRSYVVAFSVNTTATWEYKTIVIAPSPTAGTWNFTTGIGAFISFALAAGTTFHTTGNTWQTGNFLATSAQTNGVDSTANDFRLALVKIEPGVIATPYILEDFAQLKSTCQRYFWKSFPYATAPATGVGINTSGILRFNAVVAGAASNRLPTVYLPTRMRVSPTITFFNPAAANAQVRDATAGGDCSATAVGVGSETSLMINTTGNAATAVNNNLQVHATASAEL